MVSNVNEDEPSIDNRWCEDAIAPFEKADKTDGRLALLTTLAPYRVGETIIRGSQLISPETRTLFLPSPEAAIKRGALLHSPDF